MGTGVAAYFAMATEPGAWVGPATVAAVVLIGLALRRQQGAVFVALALGSIAVGFAAAQWRTAWVTAPILSERLNAAPVEGRVVALEARTNGGRVVLEPRTIAELAADQMPALVRVSVRGDTEALRSIAAPGNWVWMRATLSPPSAPAAPGAFDFARQAWFQRIGAVGFSFGLPERVDAPPGEVDGASGWRIGVESLRHVGTFE